jgi:hypothetical protein
VFSSVLLLITPQMSYGMPPTSQAAGGHLRQQSSDLQFQDFLSIMAEPKAATPPPQQQQQQFQQQQQQQSTATGGPPSGGFTAMLAGNVMAGVQQQQQQQQRQSPQRTNQQNAASMQVRCLCECQAAELTSKPVVVELGQLT